MIVLAIVDYTEYRLYVVILYLPAGGPFVGGGNVPGRGGVAFGGGGFPDK